MGEPDHVLVAGGGDVELEAIVVFDRWPCPGIAPLADFRVAISEPHASGFPVKTGGEIDNPRIAAIGTLHHGVAKPAGKEILRHLLGMGRSKWSVVEGAYRKLPLMAAHPPELAVEWLVAANTLAEIDQDVALQYLEASLPVIDTIGAERFTLWASLGTEIARLSWKASKEYFKSSPEVFKKIDLCDMERWARLGIHLIEKSPQIKSAYGVHSMLAQGIHAGKSKKVDLAIQYFKSAPQILARLSMNDLEEWVAKGLQAADTQKDKGTSFFSLQSGSSRSAVEGLVKGLELKDIHSVLRAYAEALVLLRH